MVSFLGDPSRLSNLKIHCARPQVSQNLVHGFMLQKLFIATCASGARANMRIFGFFGGWKPHVIGTLESYSCVKPLQELVDNFVAQACAACPAAIPYKCRAKFCGPGLGESACLTAQYKTLLRQWQGKIVDPLSVATCATASTHPFCSYRKQFCMQHIHLLSSQLYIQVYLSMLWTELFFWIKFACMSNESI